MKIINADRLYAGLQMALSAFDDESTTARKGPSAPGRMDRVTQEEIDTAIKVLIEKYGPVSSFKLQAFTSLDSVRIRHSIERIQKLNPTLKGSGQKRAKVYFFESAS